MCGLFRVWLRKASLKQKEFTYHHINMNNAMAGSMNGRGYLITSKDGSAYKMEVL
jgi:hypothetical protein